MESWEKAELFGMNEGPWTSWDRKIESWLLWKLIEALSFDASETSLVGGSGLIVHKVVHIFWWNYRLFTQPARSLSWCRYFCPKKTIDLSHKMCTEMDVWDTIYLQRWLPLQQKGAILVAKWLHSTYFGHAQNMICVVRSLLLKYVKYLRNTKFENHIKVL